MYQLLYLQGRCVKLWNILFLVLLGDARMRSPTTKNYAPELPTFGAIASVSLAKVQWQCLFLEDLPCFLIYYSTNEIIFLKEHSTTICILHGY